MSPYRLSFTFGGLLIPETRVIADAFVRLGEWDAVRDEVVFKNILRKTRQESARRYVREIRERVKGAHEWEVPMIAGREGGPDEVRLVILAVTTRYYRLVSEFLVEVVRHKVLGGDFRMLRYEFQSFWDRKAQGAREMLDITENSRRKLEQVTFRMIGEAGYLPSGREGSIVPPTVPYGLSTRYAEEGDRDSLLAFLLPDREIRTLMEGSEA